MEPDEHFPFEIPESLRQKLLEVAREFRKQPTPSEAILWQAIRGKQLERIKFRRQQPVGPFVVDFYAPAYRLIVEVDGPIHQMQKEADAARQEMLEMIGMRFVRLSADLVEHDLQSALDVIRAAVQVIPHKSK